MTVTPFASTSIVSWKVRSCGLPPSRDAVLLSTRGGDYELHLGQDLSIGYLSHDAESIELYLQETLTFLPYTSEASVVLTH